jgi:DNA polymerase
MDTQQKLETISQVREEASSCPRCELAKTRKRVVFGEGDVDAQVMLVGQGPGPTDEEAGRPFAGPAGALLDKLLEGAGLDRKKLWITNVIKCWAIEEKGGRKSTRAPNAIEMKACRLWLDQELEIVNPRIIVCIGGPAAQGIIDKNFRISQDRGKWYDLEDGRKAIAILHTAFVLRLKNSDPEAYERALETIKSDLQLVVKALSEPLQDKPKPQPKQLELF